MSEQKAVRLSDIDALRGIAALLVLIFHAFGGGAILTQKISPAQISFYNVLYLVPAFGYVGVYLFFVISGFCIHIRKAKSESKGLDTKIDFLAFWKRRYVRLYPAYLGALALFIAFEYYQGRFKLSGFFIWDLVSHLLMIHNFDNRTVYSMNGVFWTLAIEEQLYLLYFLLLYLRDRFGWRVVLGVTFFARFVWLVIAVAVTKITGFELPFAEGAFANWWIWALGALAVENYFGLIKLPKWCESRVLCAGSFLIAAALHYLAFSVSAGYIFTWGAIIFEPLFWGFGSFLLINRVVGYRGKYKLTATSSLVSIFAFFGLFSYSLYLTHELVIGLFPTMSSFVVILISCVFAYFYFLILERPFMNYLARRA